MSFDPEQSEPTKLADALRAAYTHRPSIPASVDTSLLATARQAFDARRRRRMTIRWGAGFAASLAAVLAIAVVLHRPPTPGVPVASAAARGDVNADGHVDMTDVLLLAKHVAANDKSKPAWDANGDGVIDQKDVDALAAAAVSLKQPAVARATLPTLKDLGLDRLRVGSALADVSPERTFAKANPTEDGSETPR